MKKHADLALLTVDLEDPTGMGRIIRQGEQVAAIVEHKDATAQATSNKRNQHWHDDYGR